LEQAEAKFKRFGGGAPGFEGAGEGGLARKLVLSKEGKQNAQLAPDWALWPKNLLGGHPSHYMAGHGVALPPCSSSTKPETQVRPQASTLQLAALVQVAKTQLAAFAARRTSRPSNSAQMAANGHLLALPRSRRIFGASSPGFGPIRDTAYGDRRPEGNFYYRGLHQQSQGRSESDPNSGSRFWKVPEPGSWGCPSSFAQNPSGQEITSGTRFRMGRAHGQFGGREVGPPLWSLNLGVRVFPGGLAGLTRIRGALNSGAFTLLGPVCSWLDNYN